jgi:hypothetical protein
MIREHSACSVLVGGVVSGWRLRGESLHGRSPWVSGHELAQDVHGVLAVLAGGVDVAADVESALGDVVAGQAAGDLLLGVQGMDAAPGLVPQRHEHANRNHVKSLLNGGVPGMGHSAQRAALALARPVLQEQASCG